MTKTRLPAEWEQQEGILLPWPHSGTDWVDMLSAVEPVFVQIARHASRFERVVIVAPEEASPHGLLSNKGARMENITFAGCPTNDTWGRDFGPITVYRNDKPLPLDFTLNGWGEKYPAGLDNRVTTRLAAKGIFSVSPFVVDMVLEGGSIDCDGKGTLLTTSRCLLNPNRNPQMDRVQIEQSLLEQLGIERILWLDHGMLYGDDTDSHIDILARFAPDDTILHVACNDPADPQYTELREMRLQLETFRTVQGEPYNLVPLPLPAPRFNSAGERLAATYANFLVINGAVLVPVYNDPLDVEACAIIASAFPGWEIIGINASPLILQGGSLHCTTMQLPKGVLA